jgi:subtilisin family serine protease
LLKRLNSFSGVWKASKAPRPVPAVWNARTYQVVTGRSNLARNFEPAQGYLHDAPVGIGIQGAWPKSGGKGKDVTVCDVEANWNRAHQDLPRSIVDFGGKKVSQQLWRDHGTAVLGILAAKLGQSGIRGICPEARLAIQSGFYDTDFNIARAIASAIKKMSRGDILLIEMQAPGPTGKYLPMHYWDDVYSALRAAVDAGIVPVVAAGNGGVNFDDSRWSGTNLQKSFDGFLVGSGVPVSNYYDSEKKYGRIGAPRSAMPNSNYGHRVNMQAWGWHVATLGYGDLQGGAEKRWATLRFAGTSSAAAIVCGAAACLQGVAKARLRTALSASELHAHLFKTGTQQTGGKNIGPQPNLAAAVDLLLK